MIAAKSTCKERWRQILPEANRVQEKHLLTLEPGISENQTAQMQTASVSLVLPSALHESYTVNQQPWLLRVRDFLELVAGKQASAV